MKRSGYVGCLGVAAVVVIAFDYFGSVALEIFGKHHYTLTQQGGSFMGWMLAPEPTMGIAPAWILGVAFLIGLAVLTKTKP